MLTYVPPPGLRLYVNADRFLSPRRRRPGILRASYFLEPHFLILSTRHLLQQLLQGHPAHQRTVLPLHVFFQSLAFEPERPSHPGLDRSLVDAHLLPVYGFC